MPHKPRNIAIVGAGIAGLACARTLAQAGHQVTLLEKDASVGGRTASCVWPPSSSFDEVIRTGDEANAAAVLGAQLHCE